MTPEKILYTARSTATGGRDGRAVSSDQVLDVALTTPRELGGAGGAGTNPEQLFAAGYSACFLGALKFVAGKAKIALPADSKITGVVGIGPIPTGFARSSRTRSVPSSSSSPARRTRPTTRARNSSARSCSSPVTPTSGGDSSSSRTTT